MFCLFSQTCNSCNITISILYRKCKIKIISVKNQIESRRNCVRRCLKQMIMKTVKFIIYTANVKATSESLIIIEARCTKYDSKVSIMIVSATRYFPRNFQVFSLLRFQRCLSAADKEPFKRLFLVFHPQFFLHASSRIVFKDINDE